MKKLAGIFILVILLFFACTSKSEVSNIVYVNVNSTGNNDGKSWKNAYIVLQNALENVNSNDVIWVAEGTYFSTDKNNTASFNMIDTVDMYGGFDGSESLIKQRNVEKNKTILTTLNGDVSDELTTVITAANSKIDGFIICNATGNGITIVGVAPTIQNCIISDNKGINGAGVHIEKTYDLENVPTFLHTTFRDNITSEGGGGVFIDKMSSAIFVDCIFDNNKCTSSKGGALYTNYGGAVLLENCLFINNFAVSGAAIGNDSALNVLISHCTFYNNTAQIAGGALYQVSGSSSNSIVTDSIIWGNYCSQDKIGSYNRKEFSPTIQFSIVQGGYDGVGVLNENPQFMNADNCNFNLASDSPAIMAGYNGSDLGFNGRVISQRTIKEYKKIIKDLVAINNPEKTDQQ